MVKPLPEDWQAPANTPPDGVAKHARSYLQDLKHKLSAYVIGQDFDVHRLIRHYSAQIDNIIITLYQHILSETETALYAVGGYGRAELFPESDIDILLILPENPSRQDYQKVEAFIQVLWQLGIEISHSVRLQKQLLDDALQDTDTLTGLLEQRQLAGKPTVIDVTCPPLIPKTAYIAAKLAEQQQRDNKKEYTGLLEPNLKTDPGGLRDLQMIDWLSIYCYHDHSRQTLIRKNLLTAGEDQQLRDSRDALWRLRFALHLNHSNHSGAKNTLTFEQQKYLAKLFHYQEQANYPAIEQLMHHYYRHSMRIRRINRRTVTLIETDHQPPQPLLPVTADFALKDNKLTLLNAQRLKTHPALLWEIFIYLQKHPDIQGIHPELVRYLRSERESVITAEFRRNSDIRRQFLTILSAAGKVYPQLRRIHRYGLLYRYITPFWYIVGRMQYDLFHQYTVDQHTLLLLRFLDQFTVADKHYPQAAEIMAGLPDPGILYLAAIFHDIGKGYNGNHSDIGAQIADLYARENDALSQGQRELLVFLVKHHLALSLTAQKKDLSDPDVIARFAALFPNRIYLDCLYLLTMADVSATNQSLWNSWRANLFHQLYRQTRHMLKHNQDGLMQLQQAECMRAKTLILNNTPQAVEMLWNQLPSAFFYAESAEIIACKTTQLLRCADKHTVSQIQKSPPRLFISSTNPADILFARITHFMEKHNCNISEARLYTTLNRRLTIQQYTLSDALPLSTAQIQALEKYSADNTIPAPFGARLNSTSLKHFFTDTVVHIRQEAQRTVLALTCKDRHGLLSLISRIFLKHHIHISHAKITTLGEKVEDTFYLTDPLHNAVTDTVQLEQLQEEIYKALK